MLRRCREMSRGAHWAVTVNGRVRNLGLSAQKSCLGLLLVWTLRSVRGQDTARLTGPRSGARCAQSTDGALESTVELAASVCLEGTELGPFEIDDCLLTGAPSVDVGAEDVAQIGTRALGERRNSRTTRLRVGDQVVGGIRWWLSSLLVRECAQCHPTAAVQAIAEAWRRASVHQQWLRTTLLTAN